MHEQIINLSEEGKRRIEREIAQMSREQFRSRMQILEKLFHIHNRAAALTALEEDLTAKSCKHERRVVVSEYAKWCDDCQTYVEVKTAFSNETEEWFAALHHNAEIAYPMKIIPAAAQVLV